MPGGGVQLLLQLEQEQKAQRHSQQHYLYPRPEQAHAQHHYQNQQFLSPQAHPPPSIPLPPLPAMTKIRGADPAEGAPSDRERRGADAAAIVISGDLQARAATGIPRSVTSSPSIPTLRTQPSSLSPSPSPSRVPTPNLRKAVSIEAFPRPPGSGIASPLGQLASSSPRNSSQSSTSLPPNSYSSSTSRLPLSPLQPPAALRKPQSKPSLRNLRSKTSTTSLTTAAASAVRNSKSESLLSIPSPPGSRSSSAPVSPATPLTPNTLVADSTMSEATHGDKEKEARGNITVSVRVRPDAAADTQPDGEWLVDGRRSLITYESGEYRYDNVFSPHDQNARVYESAAKRLVRRVMEGYHGTVFAYGMTGTGKTFSMQGTAMSPGVIPLAITDIFSYIRQNPAREFLLRVSYLEIYNEKIYDLLNPDSNEEIKLREDPRRGVYATPLKEEIVQSPNQLLRVIARGDQQRRVAGTQFNARSSRSHAVVQIVVESRERSAAPVGDSRRDKLLPGSVLVSTLSLIDLAGSEKAAESKERRTEGGHINKSLLTLGTVIARLSGDKELAEKDQKHLPYRDSKLTRLLQPALSGNSLVSILCTVQLSSASSSAAATSSHTTETLNTLKFASRAKNNLVSHAKRNESNPSDSADPRSRALLDRYKLEIIELRAQLEEQSKIKNEAEKAEKAEIEEERWRERERESAERHEEQMLEMQLARTALKERIAHLNRLILSSKSLGVNSGRFSTASSSMPILQRTSTQSTLDRPKSRRPGSSGSQTTSSRIQSGSTTAGMLPIARTSQIELASASEDENDDEEEMAADEDALDPGSASSARQISALQADLVDKDRYIATLERRLLQTRNNSYSRASSAKSPLQSRVPSRDGQNTDAIVKEKDQEIERLRQKLEDQTRMVSALRNAARKRDMLDISGPLSQHPAFRQSPTTSPEKTETRTPFRSMSRPELFRSASGPVSAVEKTSPPDSPPSGVQNFSRLSKHHTSMLSADTEGGAVPDTNGSAVELSNNVARVTSTSNVPGTKRTVDEMTKLLDEMIQDKVNTGHVIRGDRGSLRVKRDTVMSRAGNEDVPSHDAEASAAALHYEKPQFI
ncbi:kinesin-domain-containing protein [Aureobasidium sp. EXF-12298]|nr:kinesin-domain-containing protein [Aureobasidium sp. EXF-12298]KAI4751172.1 kinesin-domain-containing protein [Aureobasidium sp. EXF-12344]KAI4768582.1 kinesin-domain-containing protein [Aureobasidium sp. EXF-3400]